MLMNRYGIAIAAACVSVPMACAQPTTTTITGMTPKAMSADGRVVVGYTSAAAMHAVFWTRGDPVVVQVPSESTYPNSQAAAVSGDGSVIAGATNSGPLVSWVWSEATGMVQVTVPECWGTRATCISRDGLVVGGGTASPYSPLYQGFVWTLADGGRLVPMGSNHAAWIRALSPNGLRAVGSGSSGQGTWPTLWRSVYVWPEGLGIVPGQTSGFAYAMTPDASTVVGELSNEAFVWTAADGLAIVAPLSGYTSAKLSFVSDDGLTAAGHVHRTESGIGDVYVPVVWRRGAGLLSASSYFAGHGLTNTPNGQIVGGSASGRAFVIGTARQGDDRTFVIDLGSCGSADFDHDGSPGTDADIEAFFRCLAGDCCPLCESADFNYDGDAATDSDIEAFFRVLAGGSC
jgi:uncharacterized membrane protein